MTAAVVRLPDRLVLVVSVYVPGEDPQALRETCDSLRKAVAGVRRDAGAVVEVVIAGDFNRHDQLWGGDHVSLERQGEVMYSVLLAYGFGPIGKQAWQIARYIRDNLLHLLDIEPQRRKQVWKHKPPGPQHPCLH
jgi:hypothetical protein